MKRAIVNQGQVQRAVWGASVRTARQALGDIGGENARGGQAAGGARSVLLLFRFVLLLSLLVLFPFDPYQIGSARLAGASLLTSKQSA